MLLVFGSANVDVVFNLKRLPMPGETLLTPSHAQFSGGKGANQAVAASRMNVPTLFFGCIGQDPSGDYLQKKLGEENIELHLHESIEAPTGSAFICVDGAGENFITVSQGANHHLKAELVRDEDLRRADVVLLQMEVDEAENLALSKRAKAFGKQVILNYAPASDIKKDLLTQCDILVVNQHELRLVAASYGLVEESLHTLSKELNAALSLTMITTLGGDGVIVSQGAEIKTLPAFQIQPIDTTGAGDAFVGCFSGFLSEGDALIEAVEKAMIAAGLSCTKRGAQESYCYLEELQRHRRII